MDLTDCPTYKQDSIQKNVRDEKSRFICLGAFRALSSQTVYMCLPYRSCVGLDFAASAISRERLPLA